MNERLWTTEELTMERTTVKLRIGYFALPLLLIGALAGAWLLTRPAGAQQLQIPAETRNFMRAKLQHSQKIIEGLSTENYDMIAKHAQEMSLLSLESQWNVLRTQRYVDESAEFRHSIQRLIDATKSKRIDSAALGYVDVTLKCIHCHTYVRNKGAREAIGQHPVPADSLPGKPGSATVEAGQQ
jgi:hypothetical protein